MQETSPNSTEGLSRKAAEQMLQELIELHSKLSSKRGVFRLLFTRFATETPELDGCLREGLLGYIRAHSNGLAGELCGLASTIRKLERALGKPASDVLSC